MTSKQIRISAMINPHFYDLWKTDKPYIIAKGGRGSFKSSTISLRLVSRVKKLAQLGHKANVVCIRENTVNLRDSVYKQIAWAIDMFDMTDEFRFSVSPMLITHKTSGSTFYFYGGDKPEKLKSNTIRDVIALWYEEAANFKSAEVFDQTNPTFIRQKSPFVDQVQVYYSYNPPKNPYDWINKWVEQQVANDDYLIDTSTYLDDELGFTGKQQLKLIQTYKENDYDYYRYLYLGEPVGLGNSVYNMSQFHKLDAVFDDDPIIYLTYATDSGHAQSATTTSCYGITAKHNVILLDTLYYSPAGQAVKKAPSELAEMVHKFVVRTSEKYPEARLINRTIDSAEAALRNQYYKDFKINWHPVAKKKEADMIDFVQDLLAQGRFYYLDVANNQVFIEEHQQYRWDEKTIESDNPKVIKEHDHTCDQFKYMCIDNAELLLLKRY